MSTVDSQFVQLGATFATMAYGDAPQLIPAGFRPIDVPELAVVDKDSGFMARIYVNDTTREIWVAVAGTNKILGSGSDAAAYPSAYLSYGWVRDQVRDALALGRNVDKLIADDVRYEGYSVNTSGHSWGELFSQVYSYTFGWRGVGFDGVGANNVVMNADFGLDVQELDIAVAQGGSFISCDTNGVGPVAGVHVGSLGGDISGTRQCSVDLEGGPESYMNVLRWTAVGTAAGGAGGGALGYLISSAVEGKQLHSMANSINPAIQAGRFSVQPEQGQQTNGELAPIFEESLGGEVDLTAIGGMPIDGDARQILSEMGVTEAYMTAHPGEIKFFDTPDGIAMIIDRAGRSEEAPAYYLLKRVPESGQVGSFEAHWSTSEFFTVSFNLANSNQLYNLQGSLDTVGDRPTATEPVYSGGSFLVQEVVLAPRDISTAPAGLADIVAMQNARGNAITEADLRLVNPMTDEQASQLDPVRPLLIPERQGDKLVVTIGDVRATYSLATQSTQIEYGMDNWAYFRSDNSLAAAIGFDSASEEYSIATASAGIGTGIYVISGAEGRKPSFTDDGKISFIATTFAALIDPSAGTGSFTAGGSTFTSAAGELVTIANSATGYAQISVSGATFYANGDNGGVLSRGESAVVSIPAGARVSQLANGGFSFLPKGDTSITVSAPGGTVFVAPAGQGVVESSAGAGATLYNLGSGHSLVMDSSGSGLLSLGEDVVVTFPSGSQTQPASGGGLGYTVTPPAGEGITLSGYNNAQVTFDPGLPVSFLPDGDGGVKAFTGSTSQAGVVHVSGGGQITVGGLWSQWAGQIDSVNGGSDHATVRLKDGLTTVTVWADGLQTTSHSGPDAYESTVIDGVEVRSYHADGRISVVTSAGEAVVDTSVPNLDWDNVLLQASAKASYTGWLTGRAGELGWLDTTSSDSRKKSLNALSANPEILAIYDAALAASAINAAVVIPSTANVLRALSATVTAVTDAGLTLDKAFLENVAQQLGIKAVDGRTGGELLNSYLIKGTTALTTLAAVSTAVEHPTVKSVADAVYQAVQAGITFDPGFKVQIAQVMGILEENASGEAINTATAQVDNLLKGGGVALKVLAAADNPTPANVASAAVYLADYAGVVNLGNATFPTAQAIASAIGFVEEPTVVNGVETVLWTVAAVNAGNPVGWVAATVATVLSVAEGIFGGGGKPIVLDLDGNGVNLISVDASSAYYDMDSDQWVERRGWVGAGDGFLTYDVNGDGKISGRDELSFVGYKAGARTDLEGLVAFDSNQDGKLDASDSQWLNLKVWQDLDGDGICDDGEVVSLEQAGIASLTLASDQNRREIAGNTIFGEGKFKRIDGTIGTFADVALKAAPATAHSRPGDSAFTGPLVLNLLGDNVSTLDRREAGVTFDMEADGTAETTGWIAPDEGFLVIDNDRDAAIENGAELVGGFADLAAFDANHDGLVNGNDAAWKDLRVWVDKNQNGLSERDELYSLAQLGIGSISVASTDASRFDNGNVVEAEGTFTYSDGRLGHVASVTFTTDTDTTVHLANGDTSTFELDNGQSVQYLKGHETVDLGRNGVDVVVATGGGNVVSAGHVDSVVIVSKGGSDTLKGGTGIAVTLVGDGNDTLIGGSGETTLVSGGAGNTLIGGRGVDTVSYDGAAGPVTADLIAGRTLRSEGYSDTLIDMDNVQGSAFGDTLLGDTNNNVLDGGGGNDAVSGGAGNDTLAGGVGADTLVGGIGTDTASYRNSQGAVTVDLSTGIGSGGDAEGDLLLEVESLMGSGHADILLGNAGANWLSGAAGADLLDGGLGDDTLNGGLGADTLKGGGGSDTAAYTTSATAVSVSLGTGKGLGGDAEGDILEAIENLIGSAYDDRLSGDASINVLSGGNGKDVLDGGEGADTLIGGRGDDTYVVDVSGDVIVEDNQGGVDTVRAGLQTYVLGSQLENLIYTGTLAFVGIGNELDNTLAGGGGNDTLIGGAGRDKLIGGAGIDSASYATAAAAVTFDLSSGHGTGDASGDVFDSIEIIQGSAYADTMIGDGNSNTLLGGDGNDILVVSSGTDVFSGGAGTDTYLLTREKTGKTTIVNDGADLDKDIILFDSNISFKDVYANLDSGGDLNISIAGSTGVVVMDNWSVGSSYRNDYIRFVDSTGNINGYGNIGDFTATTISAESSNNWYLAGAATLLGSGGNDYLYALCTYGMYFDGGAGIDTLSVHSVGAGVDISLNKDWTDFSENVIIHPNAVIGEVHNIENLSGTEYVDRLGGNELSNVLFGAGGHDYLFGLNGDDTLDGGVGEDSMVGGAGNDVYYVDSYYDSVLEDSSGGTDEVRATVKTYTLGQNLENLTYIGTGKFSGTGNAGDNTLTGGDEADTLSGGDGTDKLVGGAGDDTLIGGKGADILVGGAGTDTVSYSTSTVAVTINLLTGSHTGDAVGDVFDGIEVISGTNLSDTFIGDSRANTFVGGQGLDTINYTSSSSAVQVDLMTGTGKGGDAEGDRLSAIEIVVGSVYGDVLVGDLEINDLAGGDGADTLSGGGGWDYLRGGAGADILDGGDGRDTAMYTASAAVQVDLASGIAHGGDAEGDVLTAIESLYGSAYGDWLAGDGGSNLLRGEDGNDVLAGAAGTDTLLGGAGDDTLDGGLDNDTLTGGTGNDVYLVDSVSDVVVENANEGMDEIRTTLGSYTLTAANVERLSYAGTGSFTGTGNANVNVITGGEGADTLAGGGGADTLIGGAGSDFVSYAVSGVGVTVDLSVGQGHGGDAEGDMLNGIENIHGSAFADTLVGDAGTNTLIGGAGADTLIGGAGIDVVSYSTAATAVTINLSNGQQGGDAAGDVFDGIEVIQGSSFNDMFVANAAANTIDGGAGTDTMSYVASGTAVQVNLLLGTGHGGDAEGDALVAIENLVGSSGDDVLVGSDIANSLMGGGGNDTLDGGAGGDTLIGSGGNDVYLLDSTADVVVENANEGNDEIRTTLASFSLSGTNVEKLTYIGTNAFTGTGSAGADIIIGGVGDDMLIGAAGADTLIGGAGIDVASYVSATAAVMIDLTTGISTGDAAGDVFNGIEVIQGTGFNDTFVANATANTLDGGVGTDTMSYAASAAGVHANLMTAAGVGGDAEGDVLVAMENLIGSSWDDVLVGSDIANSMVGGTGADTLDGGAGNDTLVGGAGDDLLTGGAGADVAVYAGTFADNRVRKVGDDWIVEGADGVDTLRGVETLRFADRDIDLTRNNAPTAQAKSTRTDEDMPLTILASDLLAGAWDIEGDALQLSVGNPSGGTIVLDASGNVVFAPAADFHGTAGFDYTLSDGHGGSVTQRVSIDVASVLDVATAEDGAAATVRDKSLTGVLPVRNPDLDPLSYAVVDGPSHGTLTLEADGGYIYTPAAGFTGGDSFTYRIVGSGGSIDEGRISVAVGARYLSGTSEEIRVNSYTTDDQYDPQMARLADGSFVVTWTSYGQDGSGYGVYSQRYSAAGAPLSGETRVNTATADSQYEAKVVALTGGGYVVAWKYSAGSITRTYFQRFTAGGQKVGGEVSAASSSDYALKALEALPGGGFATLWNYQNGTNAEVYACAYDADGLNLGMRRVNTTTVNTQSSPVMATLPDGGFVIAWSDASIAGIRGQRYSSSGSQVGSEFRISTTAQSWEPRMTRLADGGFVVAWYTPTSILGQRYSANAAAVGGEFRIDSYDGATSSKQMESVTALPDGGFLALWTSNGQDGSGFGLYGRRFDGAGQSVGAEFQVNTYTVANQRLSQVTVLSDGGFVVVWDSRNDTSTDLRVCGQRYDTAGQPSGGEFRLNTYAQNTQLTPKIIALSDGGFAVTWYSLSQDGSQGGIYLRTFGGENWEGGSGDDVITGGATGEKILGLGGADTLDGGAGNDTLVGGEGDDLLIGGVGIDMVLYGSAFTDNSVRKAGNDWVVDGADGVDTLRGVETLHFADREIDLRTFKINAVPVVSAPLSLSVNEDSQAITGQLSASDADNDALTWSLDTAAAHGTVTVNADGSYSYAPSANWHGEDSFTAKVLDGNGGTATQTVTISVASINDAPLAGAPQSVNDNEDNPAITGQLLACDADGDTLTWSLGTAAAHGTVMVNADGSYSYTPSTNWHGEDSFTATVSDGHGGTATQTVTVTVASVNDAPVADSPPSLSISEDSPVVTGQLSASDTDNDALTWLLGTAAAHGTVTVNADGSYSYAPSANWHGEDSFVARVSDGHGGTATQTVTVTVTPIDDPLTAATSISVSCNEDEVITGQLMASDADSALAWSQASNPAHGTVAVNADGSFVYTPDADWHGEDSFTAVVSDGNGGSAIQTVTVMVAPAGNTPMIAAVISLTGSEDEAITGQLSASDADGDALTWSLGMAAAHGTVTVNADGSYNYTPSANWHGEDSFTATVSDGHGGTATQTVTVTVASVNDAPVAGSPPSLSISEDSPVVTGQLSASDTDNDALTWLLGTAAAHGTVTVNADGSYSYAPSTNWHGEDSFAATVSDGHGGTATQTVTVTVAPIDDPLTAAASVSVSGNEDEVITGQLVASDVDSLLAWSQASNPAHGTVVINVDGSFIYTPDADWYGEDTFTAMVSDGKGAAAQQVSISVAPVSEIVTAATVREQSLTGMLPVRNPDLDPLSYVVASGPSHGTLTLAVNGSYTYTPSAGFTGSDSFTYRIAGTGGSVDEGTVSLSVGARRIGGASDEIRVNTCTAGDQYGSQMAKLADGSFVVTWTSYGQGGNVYGVYAQRYSAAGTPLGGEFRVNAAIADVHTDPKIVALAGGGYVVAWKYSAGSVTRTYFQRFTAGGQKVGSEITASSSSYDTVQALEALPGGGFTLLWNYQNGTTVDVYASVYDADGLNLGMRRVNTTTVNSQSGPAMATLPDGGFVVVWNDASIAGIRGQRYSSSGSQVGSEFRISTTAQSFEPRITRLADGGFVVAWYTPTSICGQRYSANAVAVGGEFRIDTYNGASWSKQMESVTALANGGFLALWTSNGQDGSGFGLYGRRFDGAGQPAGGEFQVNTYAVSDQRRSQVTMLSDGGFVVVWDSRNETSTDLRVYGQRYDATGLPSGGEFRLNTYAQNTQLAPKVIALSDGFAVTWSSSSQDGSGSGIYLRTFGSENWEGGSGDDVITGGATGEKILGLGGADTLDGGAGDDTLVGGDGDDLLIGGAGTDIALYAGTFADNGVRKVGADWVVEGVDGIDILRGIETLRFADRDIDLTRNNAPTAQAKSARTDEDQPLTILASDLLVGARDIEGDALQLSVGNPSGGTVAFDGAGNVVFTPAADFHGTDGFDYTLSDGHGGTVTQRVSIDVASVLDAATAEDGTATTVRDQALTGVLPVRNPDLDPLSYAVVSGPSHGTLTLGANGGYTYTPIAGFSGSDSFTYRIVGSGGSLDEGRVSVAVGARRVSGTSEEIRVNTYTTGDQYDSQMAKLADGSFVVTWTSYGQDGGGYGVYAQRYSAAGAPLGGETRVNTTTANDQWQAKVVSLTGGGYVVAWSTSNSMYGNAMGAWLQRFGADGQKVGGEIQAIGSGDVLKTLAALPGGGFVVLGESASNTNKDVYANVFNASGTALTGEFRINTTTVNSQYSPVMTTLPDGGFVAVWNDASISGIRGQRYSVNGSAVGSEFRINTTAQGWEPRITCLADGGFVVAWYTATSILGQRYSANAVAVGSEFRIDTYTSSKQMESVTALPGGGFLVLWISNGQDGSGFGLYGRRFDGAGQPAGGEFQVNTYAVSNQRFSQTVVLSDGGFVVVWDSRNDTSTDLRVCGQRYDAAGLPSGGEFRLNTYAQNTQLTPKIIALSDGGFAVTWYSLSQDGSQGGIYLRTFGGENWEGGSGDDVITGGAIGEKIFGLGGADTLDGGVGDDTLVGGAGKDIYQFGRGYGADTVSNIGQGADGDIVKFAAGITVDQLWFRHAGNDLEVSVAGTVDHVTISNWYGSTSDHVGSFVTSDNRILNDADVEKLVSAMASFIPPTLGQTNLTVDQHQQLDTVIAANWKIA